MLLPLLMIKVSFQLLMAGYFRFKANTYALFMFIANETLLSEPDQVKGTVHEDHT